MPASPQTVTAQGTAVVLAIPEDCKVIGAIAPVDPTAPKINFQVNLPTEWNGKIMQLGGSGTNGVIPVALTTGMQWGPESLPPNSPYALSRGFVTYGSDSGHQNPAPPRVAAVRPMRCCAGEAPARRPPPLQRRPVDDQRRGAAQLPVRADEEDPRRRRSRS